MGHTPFILIGHTPLVGHTLLVGHIPFIGHTCIGHTPLPLEMECGHLVGYGFSYRSEQMLLGKGTSPMETTPQQCNKESLILTMLFQR